MGWIFRIYIARFILFADTFDVVIRIGSTPLAVNTSASLIFAVQMPIAPPASCSFAIVGTLVVFRFGRRDLHLSEPGPHRREVRANLSRSTHSAGVSISHLEDASAFVRRAHRISAAV